MYCFIDVDGILCDFNRSAIEFHKLSETEIYANWEPGSYDISKAAGMSADNFYGPLKRDFWANCYPTEDAAAYIECAERIFGKENVWILTKPLEIHKCCTDGKLEWVEKHFPAYTRRTIVCFSKHACAAPSNVLFDDCDENIDNWKSRKGIGILIPRLWNSGHHIRHRAFDLYCQALAHLKKLAEKYK